MVRNDDFQEIFGALDPVQQNESGTVFCQVIISSTSQRPFSPKLGTPCNLNPCILPSKRIGMDFREFSVKGHPSQKNPQN